ncbi:MAG: hypothetical protein JWO47_266 [Candidatus Saccharibacteria bacterium]|nr:hypothetical protein [Candidatus Saccharibacteria bacterium]
MSNNGFNLLYLKSPYRDSDASTQKTQEAYGFKFDPVEKGQIALEATTLLGIVKDRDQAQEWLVREFTELRDDLNKKKVVSEDPKTRRVERSPLDVALEFVRNPEHTARYVNPTYDLPSVTTLEPFPSLSGSGFAAADLMRNASAMRFFGRRGPQYRGLLHTDGRTSTWTYENRFKFNTFGGENWLKSNGYPNHEGEVMVVRALIGKGHVTPNESDARKNERHEVGLLPQKSGREMAEALDGLQDKLSIHDIGVSRLTLSDYIILNAMRVVEGVPLASGLELPGWGSRNISVSAHQNTVFLQESDNPSLRNTYGTGVVLTRTAPQQTIS